ncbi:uncharacterized protein LOC131271376 isoform X2 [Anopheles coustani]|uniref:uncharacterized protein LOC131271376 isoform X2 n=1 Tax=Anopheles coustani TaxID=139045 RepID=UPI00265B5CE5|nr:uncharacterized protein LOC131271376 isoform X2 [Anopheles coustani]
MSKLKDSLRIIQQALSTYKPQEMFLSFNGGKDCTVLLDLIHNSMPKDAKGIKYIYVRPLNPFSEIEEFVELCREHYGITIATVTGGIKSALEVICKEDKQLKETDPGWPELMRINPLLEWTCDDIWAYIREHNVPYCTLYDRGYTSIGDKTNTVPNPHLKVDNNDEEATYLPAYALKDGDKYERAGRL